MTRGIQTTTNPNIISFHKIVKLKDDIVVNIEEYRGSIPIAYIHQLEDEGFRVLIDPDVSQVHKLPTSEWVEIIGERFIPRNKPEKVDEVKERVLNNSDIHKYELQYMKRITVILYFYGLIMVGLIASMFKDDLMRLIP